jgi:uncharacterized cupin superfamily protein
MPRPISRAVWVHHGDSEFVQILEGEEEVVKNSMRKFRMTRGTIMSGSSLRAHRVTGI